MIKIIIKRKPFLRWLLNHQSFSKIFVFKLNRFPLLEDGELLNFAYRLMVVDGKLSKHTSYDRFNDLDDIACSILDSSVEHTVHDVAASSGLSTFALKKRFVEKDIRHKIFISDKYSKFYCYGDSFCGIYDADHSLVQVECFGILADQRLSNKYLISKAAFIIIKKNLSRKFFQRYNCRVVQTYAPCVIDKIKSGEITDIDYDVFTSTVTDKFSFVRVMNLLNKNFFEDTQILTALENISNSLRNGGILQVGMTSKQGRNDASFYRKEGKKFNLLINHNAGSEINDIIQRIG